MQTVSVSELRSLLAEGHAAVVDVRTPAEFESAHIPGSFRVGLDEVRGDVPAVAMALPASAVVVCRSGARAQQACQALAAAGRDDLRILEGGIFAWERAGEAVERGRQRWDLERQVRLVAGSLVLTGVLASWAFPPALFIAGGVGAGLTFAAVTNSCAMGSLLARLPYNRGGVADTGAITERFAHLATSTGDAA